MARKQVRVAFPMLFRIVVLAGALVPISCGSQLVTSGDNAPGADPGTMSPDERFDLAKAHYAQRMAASPSGTVSGTVLGLDNAPLADISVRIGKATTTTDHAGHYTLVDIPTGNQVVTFEHPSYVLSQRPALVVPSYAPPVNVNLLARSAPQRIDADRGGTITQGPLTLHFEPNDLAFVNGRPVHGQIDVMVTAIDPRVPGHIIASPARLEGIAVTGDQVGLISYGMAEIEVSQNGEKLQVRAGESVTAAMNVTGLGPKADSIPLWHLDTELGLWVQEPVPSSFANTNLPRVGMAVVRQGLGGELVATTELPHFSQWNWDSVMGGTCTILSIPSSVKVGALRVIGTDASGVVDTAMSTAWTVNAQCLATGTAASGYGNKCLGNSPSGGSGFGLETTFKYQAQALGGTTWCDLRVGINGAQKTVLKGRDVSDWLTTYMKDDLNAWCGQPPPASGVIRGTIDLVYPSALPLNRIALVVVGSTCPGIGDLAPYTSGVAADRGFNTFAVVGGGDPGFAAMRANTLSTSSTLNRDLDRDGKTEGLDNCPANSSSQVDTNANGIGDACESWCIIPLDDPFSAFFDYDQDGIDDSCDNNYTVFNPSQYVPTF